MTHAIIYRNYSAYLMTIQALNELIVSILINKYKYKLIYSWAYSVKSSVLGTYSVPDGKDFYIIRA